MLIPEPFVYGIMLYLSFMGIFCGLRNITLNPMHFSAFLPQAFMYILFDMLDVSIAERAPYVRFSLFLVPLYFALTLTYQYWRQTWKTLR